MHPGSEAVGVSMATVQKSKEKKNRRTRKRQKKRAASGHGRASQCKQRFRADAPRSFDKHDEVPDSATAGPVPLAGAASRIGIDWSITIYPEVSRTLGPRSNHP